MNSKAYLSIKEKFSNLSKKRPLTCLYPGLSFPLLFAHGEEMAVKLTTLAPHRLISFL